MRWVADLNWVRLNRGMRNKLASKGFSPEWEYSWGLDSIWSAECECRIRAM